MKNELFKMTLLLIIGYTFLYSLPLFISFIENNLKKKNNKYNDKFVNILLYITTTLLSLIYIFLIYHSNPDSFIFKIVALSSSLLFGMIRFVEEDYRHIGKTILFNIFNILITGFIFFELIKALVMK